MKENTDKSQADRAIRGLILHSSLVYLVLLLSCFGCKRPEKKQVLEARRISNLTVHENYLYFGAGYKLCSINLSTKLLETLYRTNGIVVEQPVVSDGVVYFGGPSLCDANGVYGDKDCFFALNTQTRQILWRFRLDPYDYGTYGTYPVLADGNVLVCARRHLYCLSRKNGKVVWWIGNWFGQDTDSIQIPYLYNDHVYYKLCGLGEDDPCDGSWAVISLTEGKHITTIPVSKETKGQGVGTVDGGILYLTTRYICIAPEFLDTKLVIIMQLS